MNQNQLKNIIGGYIRYNREEDEISLNYLAEIANVNKGYLSEIENGKRMPSEDVLKSLFDAMDLPFHQVKKIIKMLEQFF